MPTSPKLKADLLHAQEGTPQVYLGQPNPLTLTLRNLTGGDLPLRAGSPANPPLAGGPFSLLLDFSPFLSAKGEQARLTLTAPGWTARYLDDPEFPAWVLCPGQPQVWADGSVLTFGIENFISTATGELYRAGLEAYNLDGWETYASQLELGVARPPAGQQSLGDALGLSLASAEVVISKREDEGFANTLTLRLLNNRPAPLVPPKTPWQGPPQFTLSFVTAAAPGHYALTTPNALDAVEVTAQTPGWEKPEKVPGSPAVWRLRPSASNHAVLGTGLEAIAQFAIGNLLTQLVPGPTVLMLHCRNVPGYADGFLALPLTKVYAPLEIVAFTTGKSAFTGQSGTPHSAYLNWQVRHATNVLLSGVGPVPSSAQDFKVTVRSNQTFVLTAFDKLGGTLQTKALALTVDPPLSTQRLPPGSLLLWKGSPGNLPAGWAVCDGTRNTPDLREFFVLGAGPGTVAHRQDARPVHTHSVTRWARRDTPIVSFLTLVHTSSTGQHTHALTATGRSLPSADPPGDAPVGTDGPVADDAGELAAWLPDAPALGPDEARAAAVALPDQLADVPPLFALRAGATQTALTEAGAHSHGVDTNKVKAELTLGTPATPPRPAWYSLYYICYVGG